MASHGDRVGKTGALRDLGSVRELTGDYPAAAGLLEQALAIYQDLGSPHGQANTLHHLGRVRCLTGDLHSARMLERSVALFREVGDAQGQSGPSTRQAHCWPRPPGRSRH